MPLVCIGATLVVTVATTHGVAAAAGAGPHHPGAPGRSRASPSGSWSPPGRDARRARAGSWCYGSDGADPARAGLLQAVGIRRDGDISETNARRRRLTYLRLARQTAPTQ